MKQILTILLLILAMDLVKPLNTGDGIPNTIYVMDLDKSPIEMWREVITAKKSLLYEFASSYEESMKLSESTKDSFL